MHNSTHYEAHVQRSSLASAMIATGVGYGLERHAWHLAVTAVWPWELVCNTELSYNVKHKSAVWDWHP